MKRIWKLEMLSVKNNANYPKKKTVGCVLIMQIIANGMFSINKSSIWVKGVLINTLPK